MRVSALTPTACFRFNHIGSINDMRSVFARPRVDQHLLAEAFMSENARIARGNGRAIETDHREIIRSLTALAWAAKIYETLPDAKIDVRVLQAPITSMHWIRYQLELGDSMLGRVPSATVPKLFLAAIFACITAFETGRFNLRPDQLHGVMAMSSGNSILVAEPLLRDPWLPWLRTGFTTEWHFRPPFVKQVLGNIGRAGVAFLVPPREPLVKSFDEREWQLINHDEFDGRAVDSFSSTSLHIRFTKAEFPIDTGFSGGQDVEAFLIEAVVSVHDWGEWVADLDILKALEEHLVSWCPYCF